MCTARTEQCCSSLTSTKSVPELKNPELNDAVAHDRAQLISQFM